MSRLTVTIPAETGPAVNAALEAAIGPEAAATFSTHPPHPTIPDQLDTTVLVCSWDLDATGHTDATETVAQIVEQYGKTGTGKTLKTPEIKVGPEPATAVKTTATDIAAADLSSDSPAADSLSPIVR